MVESLGSFKARCEKIVGYSWDKMPRDGKCEKHYIIASSPWGELVAQKDEYIGYCGYRLILNSPEDTRWEMERRLAIEFHGVKSWNWEECKALARVSTTAFLEGINPL